MQIEQHGGFNYLRSNHWSSLTSFALFIHIYISPFHFCVMQGRPQTAGPSPSLQSPGAVKEQHLMMLFGQDKTHNNITDRNVRQPRWALFMGHAGAKQRQHRWFLHPGNDIIICVWPNYFIAQWKSWQFAH